MKHETDMKGNMMVTIINPINTTVVYSIKDRIGSPFFLLKTINPKEMIFVTMKLLFTQLSV